MKKRTISYSMIVLLLISMSGCGNNFLPKDQGNYMASKSVSESSSDGLNENTDDAMNTKGSVKQEESTTKSQTKAEESSNQLEGKTTEQSEIVKESDSNYVEYQKGDVVDVSKQKYTYLDMEEDLHTLQKKYPNRIQLRVLATTADGNNVYEALFGNPNANKHIIIHGGIHAREYMTTLLVMKQLEYYLEEENIQAFEGASYKELFDEVAIHVIPMVNPDGIAISQYGLDGIRNEKIKNNIVSWYERDKKNGETSSSLENYLKFWKANANGVDLNRNFDYGFDEFVGNSTPGAQKYKGTSAACEVEAKALVDLTEEVKPVVAISYHATGSVIYWDYGQTGALRDECLTLVKVINGVTGYEIKYAASDKQDAAGYGDWAVMIKQIPSATVEIGTEECPLDISEFASIWEKNKELWPAIVKLYLEK